MNPRIQARIQTAARQFSKVTSGLILIAGIFVFAQHPADFFVTADRRGQLMMDDGDYSEAAKTFADPFRQAVAYYRDGDFEQAASWFGGIATADAYFNHANALMMLGKYEDAIAQYDLALQLRPDWQSATENRDIAIGRAKRLDFEGGDMTGGELGADGITFDKGQSSGEQSETTESAGGPSDQELRAMWLRQVQTTPSDFLKAKFAYQNAVKSQRASDE